MAISFKDGNSNQNYMEQNTKMIKEVFYRAHFIGGLRVNNAFILH